MSHQANQADIYRFRSGPVEIGAGFGTYVSRSDWESLVKGRPTREELTYELALTKEIDPDEAAAVVDEALRDGPLVERYGVVETEVLDE